MHTHILLGVCIQKRPAAAAAAEAGPRRLHTQLSGMVKTSGAVYTFHQAWISLSASRSCSGTSANEKNMICKNED
eukprot:1147706-Pelagomonas_calceolata.AAC.1